MTVVYPLVNKNGKIRPLIPVTLLNPFSGHSIIVDALIDTGADSCAFPEFIATATKHDLRGVNVKKSVNSGIGGTAVTTWQHTFLIGLMDPSKKVVIKWSEKELISCFEHNSAPPLLGTENFLKNFKVEIDYLKMTITLTC